MDDPIALPESWSDLRGTGENESQQRQALHAELIAEIGAGHVLAARGVTVVARAHHRDDILAEADDGTWAIVHLTWRRATEPPPWPATRVFLSLDSAVEALDAE
jgi:hypothetical protein